MAGEDAAPYVSDWRRLRGDENVRYALAGIEMLFDRGVGKVRVDLESEGAWTHGRWSWRGVWDEFRNWLARNAT